MNEWMNECIYEWMNERSMINLSMQASLQRTVFNVFNGIKN